MRIKIQNFTEFHDVFLIQIHNCRFQATLYLQHWQKSQMRIMYVGVKSKIIQGLNFFFFSRKLAFFKFWNDTNHICALRYYLVFYLSKVNNMYLLENLFEWFLKWMVKVNLHMWIGSNLIFTKWYSLNIASNFKHLLVLELELKHQFLHSNQNCLTLYPY